MKQMLQTSIRMKLTKDGRRYLTIPMRHGTPGNSVNSPEMPQHVHAIAKHLSLSHVTGSVMRPNADGRLVPRSTYQWGGRLVGDAGAQYTGMARMLGGTDKNGRKSGQYLTFRTMDEGSNGWIRKAQPGLFILRDTVASPRQTCQRYFKGYWLK
jgi:hypothetical protein